MVVTQKHALVEHYLGLTRKYLKDSERFMAKEDYVQASKKLWGAAAEHVDVTRNKFLIKSS